MIFSDILKYYDVEVIKLIKSKYKYNDMDAFREFANSKTHKMLEDLSLEMYEFSPLVIFDIWECEKNCGSPYESVYLRSLD